AAGVLPLFAVAGGLLLAAGRSTARGFSGRLCQPVVLGRRLFVTSVVAVVEGFAQRAAQVLLLVPVRIGGAVLGHDALSPTEVGVVGYSGVAWARQTTS